MNENMETMNAADTEAANVAEVIGNAAEETNAIAEGEAAENVQKETGESEAVQGAADDANLRAHFEGMQAQAAELRGLYPGFDLEKELSDPNFFRWTSPEGGMTLKQAYMALHGDEILAAGMRYAVEQSRMKTMANIRSAQSRPREGGLDAVPGAALRTDPAALSRTERAELRRRVSRGERIVF